MGKNRPYLTVRLPAITLACPITTMLFVDHVEAVLWLQECLRSDGIHANNEPACLPLSNTAAELSGQHC